MYLRLHAKSRSAVARCDRKGYLAGGTVHGTADVGITVHVNAGQSIKPQVGRVGLEPTTGGL